MRVAGVTSEAALAALRRFQQERGLPTLSQALGAFLDESLASGGKGVLNPAQDAEGHGLRAGANRALPSSNTRGEPPPDAVAFGAVREFARARLPPGHPLRDVLLAEADVLTPEEFLVKLEVWCVLVSRKA